MAEEQTVDASKLRPCAEVREEERIKTILAMANKLIDEGWCQGNLSRAGQVTKTVEVPVEKSLFFGAIKIKALSSTQVKVPGTSYCLVGAIKHAAPTRDDASKAIVKLAETIVGSGSKQSAYGAEATVINFNDGGNRTKAEVQAVLKKASK